MYRSMCLLMSLILLEHKAKMELMLKRFIQLVQSIT